MDADMVKDVPVEARLALAWNLQRGRRLLWVTLWLVLASCLLGGVIGWLDSAGASSAIETAMACSFAGLATTLVAEIVCAVAGAWLLMQVRCPACGQRFCGLGVDEPPDVDPRLPKRANVFTSKCLYCAFPV